MAAPLGTVKRNSLCVFRRFQLSRPLPLARMLRDMNTLLDITKVVGTVEQNGAFFEVCAEAEASYDSNLSRVTVNLRGYLRSAAQPSLGELPSPAWLPHPEKVEENADLDEATDLAKDAFASWSHKGSGVNLTGLGPAGAT